VRSEALIEIAYRGVRVLFELLSCGSFFLRLEGHLELESPVFGQRV